MHFLIFAIPAGASADPEDQSDALNCHLQLECRLMTLRTLRSRYTITEADMAEKHFDCGVVRTGINMPGCCYKMTFQSPILRYSLIEVLDPTSHSVLPPLTP